MFAQREVVAGRGDLQFCSLLFDAEAVEDRSQDGLTLRAVHEASRLLKIEQRFTTIGEYEALVGLACIDLEVVVMPVEIRRRDLGPVLQLLDCGLVPQPAPIAIDQKVDFAHVNSPRSNSGGRVMLQNRMKSTSVCQ